MILHECNLQVQKLFPELEASLEPQCCQDTDFPECIKKAPKGKDKRDKFMRDDRLHASDTDFKVVTH